MPCAERTGRPLNEYGKSNLIYLRKNKVETIIPKGLVVSCQALRNEPLYGGDTIPKMALAAKLGGAVGIRANTVRDINAIYRRLKGGLPIIGLIKRDYPDSPVYITPTLKEAKALIGSRCSVIAMDATARPRPNGVQIADLVRYIRARSDKPIMADIATYEEAMAADELGFDYVSTTMRSYTEETKGCAIPDPELCARLLRDVKHATVVAEGGINSCDGLREILDTGVSHVIIGGAITRPLSITQTYVNVFSSHGGFTASEN